jgi:excisionase family DNA binding protein
MKVYTVEEVAQILQLSKFAVKKYIREKKLNTIKNIGSVRISEKELKRFIDGE